VTPLTDEELEELRAGGPWAAELIPRVVEELLETRRRLESALLYREVMDGLPRGTLTDKRKQP
jgi:hypothetical protein